MFDALRTGRMMLKRRSERVTYSSVRHVVENMTKREFRVEHLAQMKHLRPDAFDWQYIRTPSAANPSQLETQLLLTFDRPGAPGQEGGGGGSVGRYGSSSELAEFRAALEQFARANPPDPETGKVPLVPQAPLPPRPPTTGTTPSRSASLPHGGLASPAARAAASPGGASGLQQAASCPPGPGALLPLPQAGSGALLGLASPGGSALSAASPSASQSQSLTRTRSRLGLPGAALPPSLAPIPEGTPTRHAAAAATRGDANVTLEEEDAEGDGGGVAAAEEPGLELSQQPGRVQPADSTVTSTQRGVGLAAGLAGGACTPQSKGPRPAAPQSTPVSQAREADPRMARLHSLLSPAALQKIREAEAAQAAATPEAKRRAEMRRAVQLLPHAYDLVRLVFGISGPTVKPLTQVAQSMCERSTQRQGLTSRDASNTLVALARAAPEFLRIEDPRVMADGSARPRSAVISRAANINAVAAKLKAVAADPDAGVDAVFGRGGAAAGAAAAPPSPGASAGMGLGGSAAGGESPAAARLQPRSLALALGEEPAGAAAAAGPSGAAAGGSGAVALGDMPPPPPSARKRPPGLPLPPPSPQVYRGGQTPIRSRSLRDGALPPAGGEPAAAAGPLQAPPGTPGRSLPPVPAGGGELLQKLCRVGASPAAQKPKAGSPADDGDAEQADGAGLTAAGGGGAAGRATAGRTPGRVGAGGRTPGRTAVQEAMLASIRRSSAKRSSRQQRSGAEGQRGEDSEAEEDAADDQPKPRRLLLDD